MPIGSGFLKLLKDIGKIIVFDDENKIIIFEGKVSKSYIRKIKGGQRITFVVPNLKGEYDVLENGNVVVYLIKDQEILFEKYLGHWQSDGSLTFKNGIIKIEITEGIS